LLPIVAQIGLNGLGRGLLTEARLGCDQHGVALLAGPSHHLLPGLAGGGGVAVQGVVIA
jgi:hypothetical protein